MEVTNTTPAEIETALNEAEAVLKSFDHHRNGIGITPDHIRTLPEWQAAKNKFNHWFKKLQEHNRQFVKNHKHTGFKIVDGKRIALYTPKK